MKFWNAEWRRKRRERQREQSERQQRNFQEYLRTKADRERAKQERLIAESAQRRQDAMKVQEARLQQQAAQRQRVEEDRLIEQARAIQREAQRQREAEAARQIVEAYSRGDFSLVLQSHLVAGIGPAVMSRMKCCRDGRVSAQVCQGSAAQLSGCFGTGDEVRL